MADNCSESQGGPEDRFATGPSLLSEAFELLTGQKAKPKQAAPAGADDKLSKFMELEARRRALEEELDAVKAELNILQDQVLDDWADRGWQNAKINGVTVYVAHEFFCSKRAGVDTQIICDTLRQHGLGNIVAEAYSAQSLKSWVKERLDNGDPIPEPLKSLLNYDSIPRLRTRRG